MPEDMEQIGRAFFRGNTLATLVTQDSDRIGYGSAALICRLKKYTKTIRKS
jgi:hypothetical protein